jgi:copper chaperone CopZ
MKAFRILSLALLLVAATATALGAQDRKAAKAKTETVTFDVSLHCDACKATVEKHIPFEKGVKDLVADLENKTVTVTFDPRKNDVESLRKAIEKLGYTATVRPATI